MLQRRSLVVAVIAGGLGAPSIAAACDVTGPHLGTHLRVPLGCPVHVYLRGELQMPFPPRLTALRGGVYVDVTASSTPTLLTIPVENTFVDCEQRVVSKTTTPESFSRFALTPGTVQVGERIGIGEGWFGGLEVLPAGPCASPDVPVLACSMSPPCGGFGPFEDFEDGGCGASAGGGALLPAGLLALLVARRRRRRA